MTNDTTFFHRALSAIGATAMSLTLLVGYFATPHMQTVSSVLA